MNVPVGNEVELRWYFATRPLTIAEEEHFFDPDRPAGQGLPPDIGYDPPVVKGKYQKPDKSTVTLETPDVVKDAAGEYHAVVLIDQKRLWSWRGEGFKLDGVTAVATTPDRPINGTQTF